MNIGQRKIAVAALVPVVAAAAVVAHLVAGTDGLLVVTLAAVVGSAGAIGWAIATAERRLRRTAQETHALLREHRRRQGELESMVAASSGRQTEQLLRTVRAAFVRLEGEWERSHAELLERLRTGAGGDTEPGDDS